MRDTHTSTVSGAEAFERAHSNEYDVSMFEPEGWNDPAPQWGPERLERFLKETEAVYSSEWYRKNIT